MRPRRPAAWELRPLDGVAGLPTRHLIDRLPEVEQRRARLLVGLELNWTHDHEHGLIHATAITEIDGSVVRIDEDEPLGGVSFAAEQLVARVGAEWTSDYAGTTLASLPLQLPASLAVDEEVLLPVETGRFDGPGLG